MGIFVKIVNRSLTLLFSQGFHLRCLNMLPWCQTLLSHWHIAVCDEVIVDQVRDMSKSKKKTHCAVTLCHLIYLMWIFDFAHYALLFLPNSNICVLDSELQCKRNIESRRLLFIDSMHSLTNRLGLVWGGSVLVHLF